MPAKVADLLFVACAAALVWFVVKSQPAEPAPCPVCPVVPTPAPTPPPEPPKPKPWGDTALASVEAQVGSFTAPDGTEAACPLPEQFHLKNRGGSDGAGLCVFASITHSATWQGVPQLKDLFQFMFKHPGGGFPSKVTKMIEQKCREQSLPVPEYIQVEGADLEVLKLACRSGRMPGVTYCYSPSGRYNGQRISHMVSLVHADDKWFGILDNNYPRSVEWLTPEEFKKTYTGGGGGWAVILLEPPPPPPPHNHVKGEYWPIRGRPLR